MCSTVRCDLLHRLCNVKICISQVLDAFTPNSVSVAVFSRYFPEIRMTMRQWRNGFRCRVGAHADNDQHVMSISAMQLKGTLYHTNLSLSMHCSLGARPFAPLILTILRCSSMALVTDVRGQLTFTHGKRAFTSKLKARLPFPI